MKLLKPKKWTEYARVAVAASLAVLVAVAAGQWMAGMVTPLSQLLERHFEQVLQVAVAPGLTALAVRRLIRREVAPLAVRVRNLEEASEERDADQEVKPSYIERAEQRWVNG